MRMVTDMTRGPRAWEEPGGPREVRVEPYLEGWAAIADELGVSENYARLMGIPVYRLGVGKSARVRIDVADLVAWIAARKAQTTR